MFVGRFSGMTLPMRRHATSSPEVFVVVASGRLAEDLADAVVAVGSDWDVMIDLRDVRRIVVDQRVVAEADALVGLVEFKVADGVVGAGEDHAFHAVLARAAS